MQNNTAGTVTLNYPVNVANGNAWTCAATANFNLGSGTVFSG
jgi:hypothetical protein